MSTTGFTLAPSPRQSAQDALSPVRPQPRAPIGNQALLRRLQPKLTVGAIDDPLEAEADKVADTVMRDEDPAVGLARAPLAISRKCAGCEEDDKKQLQPKTAGADLGRSEAPASVAEALATPGQALDPALRGDLEPRFGADFSAVRVHHDPTAARSARDLGALAYAVGPDIVFASGRYAPASESGQRLIAHELTHVLQQQSAPTLRRQAQAPVPAGPAPQAAGPADAGAGAGPTDGGAGAASAAADPDYSCQSTDPVCPTEYCQGRRQGARDGRPGRAR